MCSGIHVQGEEMVTFVLDEMGSALSHSSTAIKNAIEKNRMGAWKHHKGCFDT